MSRALSSDSGTDGTVSFFEVDLAEARVHYRQSSCSDGDGQKWPLNVGPSSLGVYGVGVELYFRSTLYTIFLFAIAALLASPLLICCLCGETLAAIEGVKNAQPVMGWLARTTIANLGSPQVDQGWRERALLRPVRLLGFEADIRDITLIAGILDALVSLLVLLLSLWMNLVCIPRAKAAHKRARVSPEAFSLAVAGLPRRLAGDQSEYSERLRIHFDALLQGQVTTRTARQGLLVVHAGDAGRVRPPLLSRLCGGGRGLDAQGRRLGVIRRVWRHSCDVEWRRTPDRPGEVTVCSVRGLAGDGVEGVLLDARLLAHLESAGCSPSQLPGGSDKFRPLVHAVSLVRDYNDKLHAARLEAVQREKELERTTTDVVVRVAWALSEAGSGAPSEISSVSRLGTPVGQVSLPEFGPSSTPAGCRSSDASDVGHFGMQSAQLAVAAISQTPQVDLGDMHDRDVLSAFVTFTFVRHRNFLLHSQYRVSSFRLARWLQPQRLRFWGHALRVEKAPSPSDIFWENLDFPVRRQRARRRWVLLSCVAVLATSFLLLSATRHFAVQQRSSHVAATSNCDRDDLKPANGTAVECLCSDIGYVQIVKDEPPGIYESCLGFLSASLRAGALEAAAAVGVVFIGGITTPLIVAIAGWERPRTLTARSHRTMTVVFCVQLIDIGLITALVHWRAPVDVLGQGLFGIIGNGSFSDFEFEWYMVVGASILVTMTINALWPLFSVTYVWMMNVLRWCCVRRLSRRRRRVRTELMSLHTPPQFDLAVQHAQQLCGIFVTLIFSAGLPLLPLLLLMSSALYYWTDKYILLRASCIPPRYTHTLTSWCASALPLAVAAHSGVAVWVFGNTEVAPSWSCPEGWLICHVLDRASKAASSPILRAVIRRASTASALPSTLVFALICSVVTLRALQAVLMPKKSLDLLPRFRWRRKTPDCDSALSCPFGEEPLEELKRMKVAHSYDITDVPEYRFLRPGGVESSWLSESCSPHVCADGDTSSSFSGISESRRGSKGTTSSRGSKGIQRCEAQAAGETSSAEPRVQHPIAVKFAPELLESTFRGEDWKAEFDSFTRLHCPRFRAFDPAGEFDATMTEVHKKFCSMVDTRISRLVEMGLDMGMLEDILQLSKEKAALAGLADIFESYMDFYKFGLLMRNNCLECSLSPNRDGAASGNSPSHCRRRLSMPPRVGEESLQRELNETPSVAGKLTVRVWMSEEDTIGENDEPASSRTRSKPVDSQTTKPDHSAAKGRGATKLARAVGLDLDAAGHIHL